MDYIALCHYIVPLYFLVVYTQICMLKNTFGTFITKLGSINYCLKPSYKEVNFPYIIFGKTHLWPRNDIATGDKGFQARTASAHNLRFAVAWDIFYTLVPARDIIGSTYSNSKFSILDSSTKFIFSVLRQMKWHKMCKIWLNTLIGRKEDLYKEVQT